MNGLFFHLAVTFHLLESQIFLVLLQAIPGMVITNATNGQSMREKERCLSWPLITSDSIAVSCLVRVAHRSNLQHQPDRKINADAGSQGRLFSLLSSGPYI